MNTNPNVRLLTPSEAPLYVALRRLMLKEAPWAFMASPESDRGSDVSGVAASLSGPDFAIAGAVMEGDLVSTAVTLRDPHAKRSHVAMMVSVFTRPDWRRRGLSRRVLSLAIETARGWPGVEIVVLSVSERSAEARRLYESLGFAAWGVEPDALRVEGRSHAEVHMQRRVR